MNRFIAAVMSLSVVSCASAKVSPEVAQHASDVGARVEGARVYDDVKSLAALHASDVPIDCASLGSTLPTWCHLTHGATRAFIETRFQSLGLTPQFDASDAHPATSNIIAEVRGTSKPDEVVLLGAHFDAFYQGADDNSTGVAVMLEVARVVASAPLARTVRFVGFDHEEIGLVGSTRHLHSSWQRPVMALVLDCVGYADSTPGSQGTLPGFPTPSAADFLAAVGNDASRGAVEQLLEVVKGQSLPPVQAILAPGLGAGPLTGNLMRSDHTASWLAGERAVFFTDTANFRNKNYHQPTDTPDTLNQSFLSGAAVITAMAIATWGEAQ